MPTSRIVAVFVATIIAGCAIGTGDIETPPTATVTLGPILGESPSANLTPRPTGTPPTSSATADTGELRLDDLTWTITNTTFDGISGDRVGGLFVNGRGQLVAWGPFSRYTEAARESGTMFWATADGQSWSSSRFPGDGRWIDIRDVAHGPAGYVAVGAIDEHATAWHSPDGVSWTMAPLPLPPSDGESLVAVAGGSDGYLAVGSIGVGQSRLAGWFSATGTEWTLLENEPIAGWFADVTVGPDGNFVAVGSDYSASSAHESVVHDAVWRASADGSDWRRSARLATSDGPGQDDLSYVVALPNGYFAMGMHALPGAEISCKGCEFDPDLWRAYTSLDGTTWDRHKITSVDEPRPGLPWYGALTPWRDGLLAVGPDNNDNNLVWLSDDGVSWTAVGAPIGEGGDEVYQHALIYGDLIVLGGTGSETGLIAIGSSPR